MRKKLSSEELLSGIFTLRRDGVCNILVLVFPMVYLEHWVLLLRFWSGHQGNVLP
jgi:hypothetical protein